MRIPGDFRNDWDRRFRKPDPGPDGAATAPHPVDSWIPEGHEHIEHIEPDIVSPRATGFGAQSWPLYWLDARTRRICPLDLAVLYSWIANELGLRDRGRRESFSVTKWSDAAVSSAAFLRVVLGGQAWIAAFSGQQIGFAE